MKQTTRDIIVGETGAGALMTEDAPVNDAGRPTTVAMLREAIETMLSTLAPQNGYTSFLSKRNSVAILKLGETSAVRQNYPRWTVTMDSLHSTLLPSSRSKKTVGYWVQILMREFDKGPSIQEQSETLVDELDRLTAKNSDLNGLVDSFSLVSVVTDAGALYPESLVIAFFELEYRKETRY